MRVPLPLRPDKNTGCLITVMLIVSLIPCEPTRAALHHSNRESARIINSLSDFFNIFGSVNGSEESHEEIGRSSFEPKTPKFNDNVEDRNSERGPLNERLEAGIDVSKNMRVHEIKEGQNRNFDEGNLYRTSYEINQDSVENGHLKNQDPRPKLNEKQEPSGRMAVNTFANFDRKYDLTSGRTFNNKIFQETRTNPSRPKLKSDKILIDSESKRSVTSTETKLKRELTQDGFLFQSALERSARNDNLSKSSFLATPDESLKEEDNNFLFIENRPIANRKRWRNLFSNERKHLGSYNYFKLETRDSDGNSLGATNNQNKTPVAQRKSNLSKFVDKKEGDNKNVAISNNDPISIDRTLYHAKNHSKLIETQNVFPELAHGEANKHSRSKSYSNLKVSHHEDKIEGFRKKTTQNALFSASTEKLAPYHYGYIQQSKKTPVDFSGVKSHALQTNKENTQRTQNQNYLPAMTKDRFSTPSRKNTLLQHGSTNKFSRSDSIWDRSTRRLIESSVNAMDLSRKSGGPFRSYATVRAVGNTFNERYNQLPRTMRARNFHNQQNIRHEAKDIPTGRQLQSSKDEIILSDTRTNHNFQKVHDETRNIMSYPTQSSPKVKQIFNMNTIEKTKLRGLKTRELSILDRTSKKFQIPAAAHPYSNLDKCLDQTRFSRLEPSNFEVKKPSRTEADSEYSTLRVPQRLDSIQSEKLILDEAPTYELNTNGIQKMYSRHLLEIKDDFLDLKSEDSRNSHNLLRMRVQNQEIGSMNSRIRNQKILSKTICNGNNQYQTLSQVTTPANNHETVRALEKNIQNSNSSIQRKFFINNDLKCQFLRGNLPSATLHEIEEQMKRENHYSYMNRVDIMKPKTKSIIYKIVLINNTNSDSQNKKGKSHRVFNHSKGNQTQNFVQNLYHRLDSKSRGCIESSGTNTNQLDSVKRTNDKKIPKYVDLRKIRDRHYALVLKMGQLEKKKSSSLYLTTFPGVTNSFYDSNPSQPIAPIYQTFSTDWIPVNNYVTRKMNPNAMKGLKQGTNGRIRSQTVLIESLDHEQNITHVNNVAEVTCSEVQVCQLVRTSKPLKDQIKESIKSIYPGKPKCVQVCDQGEVTQTTMRSYEPYTSSLVPGSTLTQNHVPRTNESPRTTLRSRATIMPITTDRFRDKNVTSNLQPATSQRPFKITTDVNRSPRNESFYIFNASTATLISQTTQNKTTTTNHSIKPLENKAKQKPHEAAAGQNMPQHRRRNFGNTTRKQLKNVNKAQYISKNIFAESSNLIQTGESNARYQFDTGCDRQTDEKEATYIGPKYTESTPSGNPEKVTEMRSSLGMTNSDSHGAASQDDMSKHAEILQSSTRDIRLSESVDLQATQVSDTSLGRVLGSNEEATMIPNLTMQLMVSKTLSPLPCSANVTEMSTLKDDTSSNVIQTIQKTKNQNMTATVQKIAELKADNPSIPSEKCPTGLTSTETNCVIQASIAESTVLMTTDKLEIIPNIFEPAQSIYDAKITTATNPGEMTATSSPLKTSLSTKQESATTALLLMEAARNCEDTIRPTNTSEIETTETSNLDSTSNLTTPLDNLTHSLMTEKPGTQGINTRNNNQESIDAQRELRLDQSKADDPERFNQRQFNQDSRKIELIEFQGINNSTVLNESLRQETHDVKNEAGTKVIISTNKMAIGIAEENHPKQELGNSTAASDRTTPSLISRADGEKLANSSRFVNFSVNSRGFTQRNVQQSTPNNVERQISEVMGVLDQLLGNLSAVNNHLLAYPAATTSASLNSVIPKVYDEKIEGPSQLINLAASTPWTSHAIRNGQPFEIIQSESFLNRADVSTVHGGLVWNINNATFMINGGSTDSVQSPVTWTPYNFKKESNTDSRAIDYSHLQKDPSFYKPVTHAPFISSSQNLRQEKKFPESYGKNSMEIFLNRSPEKSTSFTIGGAGFKSWNDKDGTLNPFLVANGQYSEGFPHTSPHSDCRMTSFDALNTKKLIQIPAKSSYGTRPNLIAVKNERDKLSTNSFYQNPQGKMYSLDQVTEVGKEGQVHLEYSGVVINPNAGVSMNVFKAPIEEVLTKDGKFVVEVSTLPSYPFAIHQDSFLDVANTERQIVMPKVDPVGEYLNYSWQILKNGTDEMLKNSIEMRKAGGSVAPPGNIIQRVPQMDKFDNVLKIQNYLPQNLSQTVYNYNNYDPASFVTPRKITHFMKEGSENFEGSNAMANTFGDAANEDHGTATMASNLLPYSSLNGKKPENEQISLSPSGQTPISIMTSLTQENKRDKNRKKSTTMKTGYFQFKKRLNQSLTEELKDKSKKIKGNETMQKQFLLDVLKNSSLTLKEFQDKMQQLNQDVQRQRQLLLNLQTIQEKRYHRKLPMLSGDQLNKLLDSILKKSQTMSLELSPYQYSENTKLSNLKNPPLPTGSRTAGHNYNLLQNPAPKMANKIPTEKQKVSQTKHRVFPNGKKAYQTRMKAVTSPTQLKTDDYNLFKKTVTPFLFSGGNVGKPVVFDNQNLLEINSNAVHSQTTGQNRCFQLSSNMVCFTVPTPACVYVNSDSSHLKQDNNMRKMKPKNTANVARAVKRTLNEKETIQHIKHENGTDGIQTFNKSETNEQFGDQTNLTSDDTDYGVAPCDQAFVRNPLKIGKPNSESKLHRTDKLNSATITNIARFHQRQRQKKTRTDVKVQKFRNYKPLDRNGCSNQNINYVLIEKKVPLVDLATESKLEPAKVNSSVSSKVLASSVITERHADLESPGTFELTQRSMGIDLSENKDVLNDLDTDKNSQASDRVCLDGHCSRQEEETLRPIKLVDMQKANGRCVQNEELKTDLLQTLITYANHQQSISGTMIPENLSPSQYPNHVNDVPKISPFVRDQHIFDNASNRLANYVPLAEKAPSAPIYPVLEETGMDKPSAVHAAEELRLGQSSEEAVQVFPPQYLAKTKFPPIPEHHMIQPQLSAQRYVQMNSLNRPFLKNENTAPLSAEDPNMFQTPLDAAQLPTVYLAIPPNHFPILQVGMQSSPSEGITAEIQGQFRQRIPNAGSPNFQSKNYYELAKQQSNLMPPTMLMQTYSSTPSKTINMMTSRVFPDTQLYDNFSSSIFNGALRGNLFHDSQTPSEPVIRQNSQFAQGMDRSFSNFPPAFVEVGTQGPMMLAAQPPSQQNPQENLDLMELPKPLRFLNSFKFTNQKAPMWMGQAFPQLLPETMQNPSIDQAMPERVFPSQFQGMVPIDSSTVASPSIQPVSQVLAPHFQRGFFSYTELQTIPQNAESVEFTTLEPTMADGLLLGNPCSLQPQNSDNRQLLGQYLQIANQRSIEDGVKPSNMERTSTFQANLPNPLQAVRLPLQYDQSRGNLLPEIQLEEIYRDSTSAVPKVPQSVCGSQRLEPTTEISNQPYHMIPVQILYGKLPSQPISSQSLAEIQKPSLTLIHPPMLVLPSIHLPPTAIPVELKNGQPFQINGASTSPHNLVTAHPMQFFHFTAPSQQFTMVAPFIPSEETASQQTPLVAPQCAPIGQLQADNQYPPPGVDVATPQSSRQAGQTYCSCSNECIEQSPRQMADTPQTKNEPSNNQVEQSPKQFANTPQMKNDPSNNNDGNCINNIYIDCAGKRQTMGNSALQRFIRVKSVSKSDSVTELEKSGLRILGEAEQIVKQMSHRDGQPEWTSPANLHTQTERPIQNLKSQISKPSQESQQFLQIKEKHKNHTFWATSEASLPPRDNLSNGEVKQGAELTTIDFKMPSLQPRGVILKHVFLPQKTSQPISTTIKQQILQFQTKLSTNQSSNDQKMRENEKHFVPDNTHARAILRNQTVKYPFHHNISLNAKPSLKPGKGNYNRLGHEKNYQAIRTKSQGTLTSNFEDESLIQDWERKSFRNGTWSKKKLNTTGAENKDFFDTFVPIKDSIANLKGTEDVLSLHSQGKAYVLQASPNVSMNDQFLEKYLTIVTTKDVISPINQNKRFEDTVNRQYKQLQFDDGNFKNVSWSEAVKRGTTLQVYPKSDPVSLQTRPTIIMQTSAQPIISDSNLPSREARRKVNPLQIYQNPLPNSFSNLQDTPMSTPTLYYRQRIPSAQSPFSAEWSPLPGLTLLKLSPNSTIRQILLDRKTFEDYYSNIKPSPDSGKPRSFYSTSQNNSKSEQTENSGPMLQLQLTVHPVSSVNRSMVEIETSSNQTGIFGKEKFNSVLSQPNVNSSTIVAKYKTFSENKINGEGSKGTDAQNTSNEDILRKFFAKIRKIKKNFLSNQKTSSPEYRNVTTFSPRYKVLTTTRKGGSKIMTFKYKTRR